MHCQDAWASPVCSICSDISLSNALGPSCRNSNSLSDVEEWTPNGLPPCQSRSAWSWHCSWYASLSSVAVGWVLPYIITKCLLKHFLRSLKQICQASSKTWNQHTAPSSLLFHLTGESKHTADSIIQKRLWRNLQHYLIAQEGNIYGECSTWPV